VAEAKKQEQKQEEKPEAAGNVQAKLDLEREKVPEKPKPVSKLRRTNAALDEIMSTSQGKTYVTLAITVVITAVMIFFAVSPALSSITRQLDKNNVLVERNQKMSSKVSTILALQQKEQASKASYEDFEAILSNDLNETKVYTEIYNILKSKVPQAKLRSVSFTKSAEGAPNFADLGLDPKTGIVNLRITAVMPVASVDELVKTLEESDKIYNIQTMGIAKTDDVVGDNIQVDVQGYTLYWLTDEELGNLNQ
jgi:hypothetical protein